MVHIHVTVKKNLNFNKVLMHFSICIMTNIIINAMWQLVAHIFFVIILNIAKGKFKCFSNLYTFKLFSKTVLR